MSHCESVTMTYRPSSAKRRQVYSIPGVFNDRVERSESKSINARCARDIVAMCVVGSLFALTAPHEIDSFDLSLRMCRARIHDRANYKMGIHDSRNFL